MLKGFWFLPASSVADANSTHIGPNKNRHVFWGFAAMIQLSNGLF